MQGAVNYHKNAFLTTDCTSEISYFYSMNFVIEYVLL